MSTLYCILTFLPTTLQALGLLDVLPSKRLLLNLHRFFTLAFWSPSLQHDGEQAWTFVHGDKMDSYHRALQILAANFIKSVEKFAQSYPTLSTHVDRPNIHRLMELVYHTIPMMNHISYVCELVFESAHQPLKFFLSRNHTLNSHVYSVQLILAKDWLIRLWSLWRVYKDECDEDKYRKFALLGMIRLIGGKEVDNIQWDSPALSPAIDELRAHIHELMDGLVERRLHRWYHEAQMTFTSQPFWVLHPPPKGHTFNVAQTRFYNSALTDLSELGRQSRSDLKLCNKALLDRGFGSMTKSSHERLEVGDIVQLLLQPGFEDKKFTSQFISSKGIPAFFTVGGFIKSKSGTNWAIIKQCKMLSPIRLPQIPDINLPPFVEVQTVGFFNNITDSPWHYVELSNDVRKVGAVHNCGSHGSCHFSSRTLAVNHSHTTLDAGRFYLLTKRMGYPPRRS